MGEKVRREKKHVHRYKLVQKYSDWDYLTIVQRCVCGDIKTDVIDI